MLLMDIRTPVPCRGQDGSPNDSKSSLRASHMCAATASLTYASGIIPTAV